jgi:hypothetical protein
MPSFTCDVVKKSARSKQLNQTGELVLMTIVTVGDNYRTESVPVSVKLDAIFTPDRKFWEHADEDRDERYAAHYSKSFSTPEERQSYCNTFYELLSKASV